MAESSLSRADVGPSRTKVTRPRRQTSRYDYEQRVTAASWVGLLIVIAGLWAWAQDSSRIGRSDSSDSAAPPAPGVSTSLAPVTLPAWLAASEPSIDGVVAARNKVAAAAARRDIAAMGAACRAASSAVATLHQQLPSPEPVLNTTLHQAVDSYETGLPYCISATRNLDAQGLQRAAMYISDGDAAMRLALDLLGQNFDVADPGSGLLIV